MKINKVGFILFILLSLSEVYAQERTKLDLSEAVQLAISKSFEAQLSETKAKTKALEYASSQNKQYPEVSLTGQYLRLTDADVALKLLPNSSGNVAGSPVVNELLLGQANFNLPLFSGFKIQNSIGLSQNLWEAEKLKTAQTKEDIAMHVVAYYAALFRAQKAVELITDNLKSANQRVSDFKDLEKNGLVARNDLLKVQLQSNKIALSLEEAHKNVAVINYQLVSMLQLPQDFLIGIDVHQFDHQTSLQIIEHDDVALSNRKDLKAFQFFEKANQNLIKITKSNYFPNIALVGGYTALRLQNVATVSNAMTFGVGFSYNLSSIYKNNKDVKIAFSKAQETIESKNILIEKIKVQVHEAYENFILAQKQHTVYASAIQVASENYRIVKDKYDNGLATTTELLDADVEQLNAQINQAYAKANIMLKYYEMQEASGALLSSFNLTKN